MTFEQILDKLQARRNGKEYAAKCPAHEDSTASLAITHGANGQTLLHCHANCTTESILAAMHWTWNDLYPNQGQRETQREIINVYEYKGENGVLLFQVVRYFPKDFRQRRPDGNGGWIWNLDGVRKVLYRLPELLTTQATEIVWITEGEKDADNLVKLGLTATCNVGGAGKWQKEYSEALRGRRVAIHY